mmetsp:Transcript_25410/g.37959  ORF Transcript_25410/g.37959 Transcript_25410/m.37959 type:complete len:83 (-) Transcript_25410:589-837(-)
MANMSSLKDENVGSMKMLQVLFLNLIKCSTSTPNLILVPFCFPERPVLLIISMEEILIPPLILKYQFPINSYSLKSIKDSDI